MLMHEAQEIKGSLVDCYASYEHLMNYWAETMQDDCYLISRDGWKVELLPPAKKNASWEDYVCDLLPVQVVVNESYINERDKISSLKVALEETAAALAEIDEKLEEENSEEDVDEEALTEERKNLDKKAKALRKQIKAANDDLVQKLVKEYATMNEQSIRHYVVETKWAEASEKAVYARNFAKAHNDWVDWKEIFETRNAETLANLMLTICNQTSYMLSRMIERQESDFKQIGGVRERMYAARTAARGDAFDKGLYSRLAEAKTPEELVARVTELRQKIDRTAWSMRRKKGWG